MRVRNSRFLLLVAALLCQMAALVCADEPEENQEPPQIFFLEIADKRVPVSLNEPFETAALSGQKTAVLRVEPYRQFDFASVKFRYPREFTFEADLSDEAVSIWTLSGNNCVVMVQRYPGTKDHQSIRNQVVRALAEQYENGVKGEAATTLEIDSEKLTGVGLEVELAGTTLRQELFSFASGENSIVLMLQDSPGGQGEASAERVAVAKLLKESFKLPAE